MDPRERPEGAELDELLVRPGTYFNPQTEIGVVFDDSLEVDREIFNMEEYEGADWVRISDEVPIDEDALGQLLEAFQTHYHAGSEDSLSPAALDHGEEDVEGPEPALED